MTTHQTVRVDGPHPIAARHIDCCDYRNTGLYCDNGTDLGPREWLTVAVDGESFMLHLDNLAELTNALAAVEVSA